MVTFYYSHQTIYLERVEPPRKTAGNCFGAGCPSALGLENNVTVFYGLPRTLTATIDYRF